MTPQELEIVRINARITAIETCLAGLLSGVRAFPDVQKALLLKLDELPQSLSSMTIPGLDAAHSDMLAGEAQQAVTDLVSFVKSHIGK